MSAHLGDANITLVMASFKSMGQCLKRLGGQLTCRFITVEILPAERIKQKENCILLATYFVLDDSGNF